VWIIVVAPILASVELSIRIMAHPLRTGWAEELSDQLSAPIVWDETNSAWDTGKRALLSGAGTHVLVVQDDVILSDGLREVAAAMVEHSNNHPICLYSQHHKKMAAVERWRTDQPWYLAPGPNYGPAVIIPTVHVPDLVKVGDIMRGPSYDRRLWNYYAGAQILCLYTFPSLVNHRVGHGSLMHKNARDRAAYNFGSGVGTDWSVPPLVADNRALYPVVRMVNGSRSKNVRYLSGAYKQALRAGFTEA
jgi:hypothetical protein